MNSNPLGKRLQNHLNKMEKAAVELLAMVKGHPTLSHSKQAKELRRLLKNSILRQARIPVQKPPVLPRISSPERGVTVHRECRAVSATYGCHNRLTIVDHRHVQNGWVYGGPDLSSRAPFLIWIKDSMTKDCQYSKDHRDPKCTGCRWQAADKVA